jgi:hypothetical protein
LEVNTPDLRLPETPDLMSRLIMITYAHIGIIA